MRTTATVQVGEIAQRNQVLVEPVPAELLPMGHSLTSDSGSTRRQELVENPFAFGVAGTVPAYDRGGPVRRDIDRVAATDHQFDARRDAVRAFLPRGNREDLAELHEVDDSFLTSVQARRLDERVGAGLLDLDVCNLGLLDHHVHGCAVRLPPDRRHLNPGAFVDHGDLRLRHAILVGGKADDERALRADRNVSRLAFE